MYPNPSQAQQWNPNAPPPTAQQPQQQQQPQQPQQQQQPQQGWSPQPPNGQQQQQYAPRPNQIPPISQPLPHGAPVMQTLQPQHPDQYRALPPPQQMYGPPYQPQGMPYPPPQPAPRQRTAIACRYCRRRKIRCSGFDQSEDGRCTNCQRFTQECVFTPVSAQTQAFVPAHTVWRGQNPPPNTQLYGAYGQPLPQHGDRNQYPPQQQQPGQYPPPPPGYQPQQMYPQQPGQGPPGMTQPQGPPSDGGRKRPSDEPHTPTIAPPPPGSFSYPDPQGLNPAEDKEIDGSATTQGAETHEMPRRRERYSEVKDVGVQTDDLPPAPEKLAA